jgi:4-amino-4-deoxy-L-arabinose transferase-like glycosyltransferase
VAVGFLLLVLTLGMLVASGVLLCALCRLESVGELLLGTYVVGFAELVFLSLALSLPRALTTTTLLVGIALVLVVIALVWARAGRPAPPPVASALANGARLLADPVLATLAVGVGLALVYVVALGTLTPQIDSDSIAYHLPRAAFWKQQHAVAYIAGGVDSRQNASPPVAEIGILLTMLTTHGDRLVWLPQLLALLGSALAVFCLARRTGAQANEALFGALLFMALPVVVQQSATALNDLVVAVFLLAATVFAFGRSNAQLALGTTSLALAVGTKVSGVFAIPLLVALVFLVQPASRRWRTLIAGGCATALGAGWYVLDRVETGSFFGGLFISRGGGATGVPERYTQRLRSFSHFVTPGRLALDFVEAPGAVGRDLFVYGIAALGVFAVVAASARRRGETVRPAMIAACLALVPLLIPRTEHGLLHVWQKAWVVVGRRDIGFVDGARDVTQSNPLFSWFGPVGLLLGIVASYFVWRELRRRGKGKLAGLFLLTPLIWLVIVGWFLGYNEFEGRYLIYPMALVASCWGVLFRFRAVAMAAVAVSVTTLLLVFVHLRLQPPGIRLLEPVPGRAVWHISRARQMTGEGDEATLIDYIDAHLASHAAIALPERPDFLQYPYFGPSLSHHVYLGSRQVQARADAIVFDHGPPTLACPTCWRLAIRYPSGFGLLVRIRPRSA